MVPGQGNSQNKTWQNLTNDGMGNSVDRLSKVSKILVYWTCPCLDSLRESWITGKFEELEQYIIYDGNELIADVGGYLGLLLGHSIFSLYKHMIAVIGEAKTKLGFGVRREQIKFWLMSFDSMQTVNFTPTRILDSIGRFQPIPTRGSSGLRLTS